MSLIKEEILKRLKGEPGRFISGAELKRGLAVTRAAVWKQVEALRREGYRIEARPRLGYRLAGEPDRLDPRLLAAQENIHYYPAVDSTNDTAREMAEKGAPCGTVVIAETQHRGRGRRGRSWSSLPGKGLWFSTVLRPPDLSPAAATPVTLVVAAVLAEHLTRETGAAVKVKWPNDLLVEGKKIGGILTELKGEPDRVEYLIIGTGLNVNHTAMDFPPSLRHRAGSLYLAGGRPYNRTALFLALRGALMEACRRFFDLGFAPFRPLWIKYNTTLGIQVTVQWPGGGISGRAVDLDGSGALLLEDGTGKRHCISYGEIL